MDSDESLNFCPACGAALHASDTFCPKCGQDLTPGSMAKQYSGQQDRYKPAVYQDRLRIVAILGVIWTIAALIIGIDTIFSTDAVIDQLKNDPTYWDQIMEYFTEDQIRNMIAWMGYILIASGVLALISSVCCFLRRGYYVALLCCIVGSILGLIVIIGLVGFLAAYWIIQGKGYFREYEVSGGI